MHRVAFLTFLHGSLSTSSIRTSMLQPLSVNLLFKEFFKSILLNTFVIYIIASVKSANI